MSELEIELRDLLNKHSEDNASNTPDFILSEYLQACLEAFHAAIWARETWYGRDGRPTEAGYDINQLRTVSGDESKA